MRLDAEVAVVSPLPNAELGLNLNASVIANRDTPQPQVQLFVDLEWGSDWLAFIFGGVPVLLAKESLEFVIEETAPAVLRSKIEERTQRTTHLSLRPHG